MLHTELGELPADTPLPTTPEFLAAAAKPRCRRCARPAPVRVRRHGVADLDGPQRAALPEAARAAGGNLPQLSPRLRRRRSTRTPTKATGRKSRPRPTPTPRSEDLYQAQRWPSRPGLLA